MPSNNTDGVKWELLTGIEKLIIDYTGLNLFEVMDLDFDVHYLLYRDGLIHKLMQTESGRGYLEEAWLLRQTKPDRKELRRHFQRGSD